jgi:hypothetical protein
VNIHEGIAFLEAVREPADVAPLAVRNLAPFLANWAFVQP